jgi:hypothetical protein
VKSGLSVIASKHVTHFRDLDVDGGDIEVEGLLKMAGWLSLIFMI